MEALVKAQNEQYNYKIAQLAEAEKILKKVTDMRNFQKLFFKTKDRDTLDKCKNLEKEIDRDISRYNQAVEFNLFNQNIT
jgi:hypothetical protein